MTLRLRSVTAGALLIAAQMSVASLPSPPADAAHGHFAGFLSALGKTARDLGISSATVAAAVADLEPDPEVIELATRQPEFTAGPWDYLSRLVSNARVAAGRERLASHADLITRIEAQFGVDRAIVLAIWGIESNFGAAMGERSIIRSLATLAAGDQRRAAFWQRELLATLRLLDRGEASVDRLRGSWAGAMGHTQFMPTTYTAHAVDFDGDGRRDIWTSVADALGSTASYLKASGWRAGRPWGLEVVLPPGFDHGDVASVRAPLEAWRRRGVGRPAGEDWPSLPKGTTLQLLLPAGARGPAFLVTANFEAILKYNRSTAYALAVGHLADRISGGRPIAGAWPADDRPLGRSERAELQRLLAATGFDPGDVDGMIGSRTSVAIRSFQAHNGLAADGYASASLLSRLRLALQP